MGQPRIGGEMKKVPQETIWRMAAYLRVLLNSFSEQQNISSFDLAKIVGVNPTQLRKDLSYFGKFGRRGVGYNVKELIDKIKGILGLNKKWNVVLCGLGNLGRALACYKGFAQQGFLIKMIFEKDSKKIGKKFRGIDVFSIDKIEENLKGNDIHIGILTVPDNQAQTAAEQLYKAGLRAILNFAPVHINLEPDCKIRNVSITSDLTYLSYFLVQK